MKYAMIKQSNSSSLVAFFAGFAGSKNILDGVEIPDGFDVAIFYDYACLDCDFDFSKYSKISVIAWSFGVWVADFMADKFRAEYRVAVNGSPIPVSDYFGIAPDIFNKTLNDFDEKNKGRFYRRICGGSGQFAELGKNLSNLAAAELKLELANLGANFNAHQNSAGIWNAAIASVGDKIFSLQNMRAAWGKILAEIGGEHFNISAFNKAFALVKSRADNVRDAFERHVSSYDKHAFVQREICLTLVDDIKNFLSQEYLQNVSKIFEFGCGTGILGEEFSKYVENAEWILNDISPKMCQTAAAKIGGKRTILCADVSECKLPQNCDMIVSTSCLQWIQNPRMLFRRIVDALNDDGLLAFSTFGEKNYLQIRDILGKGLDYMSSDAICHALEDCGFSVIYVAEDLLDVEFESVAEILRHIKSTGVNGGFSEFWTPSKYKKFVGDYSAKYAEGETVKLSYNPIYVIAKKRSS